MVESPDLDMYALLTRARTKIETLEAQLSARGPIALIGLACRLPGAPDASAFWSNLIEGIDGVGRLGDDRWDTGALVGTGDQPEPGRMRTADGGFLNDIKSFDAAFFGISGREAELLDPQQRLLLETAWHAFEDAGILPASLAGSNTGVFVGISSADYGFLQSGSDAAREPWSGTGNALSIAANRLSYVFNLNGPSIAVDTACSSSLVALHQAVRSLRLGECDTAIVAGVNVLLNPDISIAFSQAGMLSPTGRCRTFDADADGYVRSEGVGVILLRRLNDAEAAGDQVRCIVAGSAINQDGRGNGLTAPNGLAQQAVVRSAMRDAGITAQDIAYIEAHGTGTPLGDPIEINNLAKVMEERRGDPVLIGAAKAAIGHTEAAAGIAGVIKTVLAMEAGMLPPQPHLVALNPRLKQAAEEVVTPVRSLTQWPETRLHAGISAFGFGGTNAHVILARYQKATASASRTSSPEKAILTLSARSEGALHALVAGVTANPPADPCDFAASLAARRTTHGHRLALPVSRNAPEAMQTALAACLEGSADTAKRGIRLGSRSPRLVFAFTGQGSQLPGMGMELYRTRTVFRQTLDRMADALEMPLATILSQADEEEMRQTALAQPAIFALQVALVEELAHHGIRPDTVMGYSLGEYTAACIAGALAPEDMARVVAERGRLFQSLPEDGGMLSLRAPAEWVEREIADKLDRLAISARISSETTVVAGDRSALDRLRQQAETMKYPARPLNVSHAFHSPLIEPVLQALGDICDRAAPRPLELPLISNIDGQVRKRGMHLDADHWMRHSRQAVEYGASLETLAQDPTTVVLEIGPNMTLTAIGRASGVLDAERFVSTLAGKGDDDARLDDALASLVALGVDLSPGLYGSGSLPGSALPLYPFERKTYWIELQKQQPLYSEPHADFSSEFVDWNLPVDGPLVGLFEEQLDLVRRTIFSQLAVVDGAVRATPETQGTVLPMEALHSVEDMPDTAVTFEEMQGIRPAAEMIWLLSQKSDDASRAYHIPVLLELSGEVDAQLLRDAYGALLARHESLRASFPDPGEMLIRPTDEISPDFASEDAREWSEAQQKAWIAGLGETVFDLASDTLLRMRLLQTGAARSLLSIEAHHLAIDGLSMNILIGELAALYNAAARNVEADLPPARPYRDWLATHLASRTGQKAQADRHYWLARLGDGAAALDLATDRPRGRDKGWRGGAVLDVMTGDETKALHSAARALGLTPYMLLHSLLAVMLARYAGQSSVAIATPTSGRSAGAQEPLVGYCSDLIFSVSTIDGEEKLEAYCQRARSALLADISHADYSFAWISQDLKATGAELPLQVVFNYQNAYVSAPFEGISANLLPRPLHYLDGELTLNAVELEDGLALELNYNSGLYEETTARALLEAYLCLLKAVAGGARGSIASLPLIDSNAVAALEMRGQGETAPNGTAPAFRRVEAIAAANPNAVALRHGAQSTTYGDMESRANNLAHRLLETGLRPEEIVAIHLPRCIDLVIAQLAISKAGGAFLVLDPRQPAEWRSKIVAQAGVSRVIGPRGDLVGLDALFIEPPADAGVWAAPPQVRVTSQQLMYVIFTSGSTGEPKGVMIEHGSVANYVNWLGRQLEIGPADRVLQFSAIGFDASIEEIYTALGHGAGLTLRDDDLPDAATFWQGLSEKQITVLDLPTAFWHELVRDDDAFAHIPLALRHVILGGEAAKPLAVARWRDLAPPRIGLWNTYGPTETTIVCTAARLDRLERLDDSAPVPIGTPVANATALVLDAQLQLAPPGAIGMLYIGGAGLARGYLHRPDLTQDAFVTLNGREGRYYRTGDLVRWRPDGLLEYHGRRDDQIKLRGFRIETGSIEKALEKLEGVSGAAVVAAQVEGATRLAAFVTPKRGAELDTELLRSQLLRSLPEYMVPQAIIATDRLPLNANGKVDRRALARIDWSAPAQATASPVTTAMTATERLLADIWAEVIGLDARTLGPDSDFFAVGGDSLLAMRVLGKLGPSRRAGIAARDLFSAVRLGDLAKLIDRPQSQNSDAVVIDIPRLDRSEPLPLSSSQRRLWFLHQFDPSSGAYNLPSRIELEGKLDISRVEKALAALATRHEALRSRFGTIDGQPVVHIDAHTSIPFESIDLSRHENPEDAVEQAAMTAAVAPFDVDGGPLARATLLRIRPDRHVLVLCLHHIITDGWSMAILGRDFAAAYAHADKADPLAHIAPPTRGYVDFAAAAADIRAKADESSLLQHWRSKLGDLPELLELPTDWPRPETPDGKGRVHRFRLPSSQTEALHAAAKRIGVTPFAVLITTWGLMLARLAGQRAFPIGTVIANRDLPGAEDVVGFFAETLALRFDVTDQPSFAVLARRAQAELLDALANSALPFEKLVDDLVTLRSDAHAPIFQTMFVWQNTPATETRVADVTMRATRLDKGATQFDLVLDMTETADGIEAMLEYRTQLFQPETVALLGERFYRVLAAACERPDAGAGELGFGEGSHYNDHTQMPDIANRRVDSVLDRWAAEQPDAIAVTFEAEDGVVSRLTWGDLRRKAEFAAAGFQQRGIGPGSVVAICAERSSDLIVAIYATMLAGAAYAPLDPRAPADRQRLLLDQSGASLLVTQAELLPLFAPASDEPAIPHVLVDALPEVGTGPLVRSSDPDAPIYIIFTSGTTGTPKGVVVPHRGVANMALGMGRLLGVGPGDSLLQFAPLNFDASALQIFLPLLSGGSTVLHHRPDRLGARDFSDLAERHGLTMLDLPAALWRQWVETMTEEGLRMAPSIRIFLTGGEALSTRTMRRWAALCDRKVIFLSSYGPTEASITASAYINDSAAMAAIEDGSASIGKPLPNVALHVLDIFGQPAAAGVVGEIAIGGPGVAIGYLDDHERTRAAFVTLPGLGRVYMSGDHGRRAADSTIEFLGRKDTQIKIRGFRVEPAEIEQALLTHPDVAAAFVTSQRSAEKRVHLVAYAVAKSGARERETTLAADLRAHLASRLPEQMVPVAILFLPAFPLLPSGKINRRALPTIPVSQASAQTYEEPLEGAEATLAAIWSQMLDVERVGRGDNFFELGGDSILSLQMAARSRRNGLAFEVRDVFRHQTLAALAAAATPATTTGEVQTQRVLRRADLRADGAAPSPADFPLASVTQAELDLIVQAVPELETLYDASYGQAGMLFHSLLSPASGAFVIQTRIDFSRLLDVDALKAAINDLVARHPVLRTGFIWQDRSRPLQAVRDSVVVDFEELDISDAPDQVEALGAIAAADLIRPIDLARPPLMRLTLVRRSAGWSLVWLKHHAVIDGWSMPLLYEDLLLFYAAHAGGRSPKVLPAPGFDRYVEWLAKFDRQQAAAHWKGELADFDTPTELGIGQGPETENGVVARTAAAVQPSTFARLTSRARAEHVTVGTLIIGALLVLLSRYAGTEEALTNVTVSGRPHDLDEAESIAGMFLNTVPMRATIDDAAPIWEWLRAIQDRHVANDAMAHLGLPEIQRSSGVPSGQRLAETLVIVQNTPLGADMSAGLGNAGAGLASLVTAVEGLQKTSAPITLFAEGRNAELTLTVQYDSGRFDAIDMQRFAARLAGILNGMIEGRTLGDLALLEAHERTAILARAEGPAADLPDAPSLIALFERQVRRTPERVALFDGARQLAFRELDARAEQIGHALLAEGIRTGDIVAVLSERSLNATAALLGVMKAGGAFLALEPGYPIDRMRFMIEDSGARVLLNGSSLSEPFDTPILQLEDIFAAQPPVSDTVSLPGSRVLTPDSLANIIYTSGSTGRPKGVRALHRGALNRFAWMWREMPFGDDEVMVQKTALSFVDSVWEIFGPLLAGLPSLVLDETSVRDVPLFMERLAENRVSRLVLVPTLLRAMLELAPDLGRRLPHLKHWISSGEALPGDLVSSFRAAAPGCRLINLYGSSEVAGDVTWYDTAEMQPGAAAASLGRPIANSSVYLLDRSLRPVPDGMPGELWIGGDNLAEGYHGQPGQTAEAFIDNPFGKGMLFRSRDWGKREDDGTITFLGRQDGQVKIRGMRVDLGEVEAVLRETDGVKAAVVLNRPGADGRARIVGWYVGNLAVPDLRAALEVRLPRHMLPSALVALEAIPLLPNGKVDRRSLPDPQQAETAEAGASMPPETPAEQALASIWADVLGIDRSGIGRTHNYFQLGGDSISAIRVATRAAADGFALSVRDVFETATLAELAARVPETRQEISGTIDLDPGTEIIPETDWPRFERQLGEAYPIERARRAVVALLAANPMLAGQIELHDEGARFTYGKDSSGKGHPIFLADVTQGHPPRIILSGHPDFLDGQFWQTVLRDLETLLAGQTPLQTGTAAQISVPRTAQKPGLLTAALPPYTLAIAHDLIALSEKNLRASPLEVIAAAAMRVTASVFPQKTVAALVPELPEDNATPTTSSLRVVSLPNSLGHPSTDLRATKRILRAGTSKPLKPGADVMTLRVVAMPDVVAAHWSVASPQHLRSNDADSHLDVFVSGDRLEAMLYTSDGRMEPAFEHYFSELKSALDAYAERGARGDGSVWLESDFPLADLRAGTAAKLAIAHPDLETVRAVTPGQTGMIFHSFTDPDNAVYGLHTTVRFAEGLDLEALKLAFSGLIQRHGTLRSSFSWELGKAPVQIVERNVSLPIHTVDWRHLPEEEYELSLKARIRADQAKPIDLSRPPAMRATVVQGPQGIMDLLWNVHHAAVDGWSLPILLRDLSLLYDQATGKAAFPLPPAPDFGSYIRWISRQDRKSAETHWRTTLGDLSSGTDMVLGKGASAEKGAFATHRLTLGIAAVRTLMERARSERVTTSTLIQGAWAALLARHNQAEEQIFGVTVSGRPAELPGIEDAVGPFVNVLPLRLPTRDGDGLWNWLRSVQQVHTQNDRFNYLSFAEIQALTSLPAGERLCDTMLVVQNFPMDDRLIGRLGASGERSAPKTGLVDLIDRIDGHQTTSYALTIFVIPQDDALEVEFVYDTGRFDQDAIDTISRHLARVFETMGSADRFDDVGILSGDEEAGMIALGRGAEGERPEATSILQLIEERIDINPAATALIHGSRHVTYGEIEAGANALAADIAARGIGRGAIVAVHIERSPEQIIALVAILKAGASWLPLDPGYPAERLAYMLEDSGAELLLHDDTAFAFEPYTPMLDVREALAEGRNEPRPVTGLHPGDLAYLIYTSGSSGRPKGVRALHRGLLARLAWSWRSLAYRPDEVAVLKTALPFVDSVAEIFGPLAAGVPMVVVPGDDVADVGRFIDILAENKVSWIVVVPSLLRTIIDLMPRTGQALPALRTWVVSGETCTAELVSAFREAFPQARLINLYGSSEVAGDVTWFATASLPLDDPLTRVPIGRPIDRSDAFILDRRRRPVPPVIPGELYIAGDNLADGYHDRPEMTDDAFLPNPFGEGRMFRTRDLARWSTDGLIDFIGRHDGQIKIRGMRIEIGEVETVLRGEPGVDDAVVKAVRAPDGGTALSAFWSGKADQAALKQGVARQLPAHMVPSYWERLAALPQLPNGKIDRRALPDIAPANRPIAASADRRAAGFLERELLPAFAAALGVTEEEVSATEDFFTLGGHSLAAARVLAETYRRTGVMLRLKQFYEGSSLKQVAARVETELLSGVSDEDIQQMIDEATREVGGEVLR